MHQFRKLAGSKGPREFESPPLRTEKLSRVLFEKAGFSCKVEPAKHARLAQLVEHLIDVERVIGSSPIARTK